MNARRPTEEAIRKKRDDAQEASNPYANKDKSPEELAYATAVNDVLTWVLGEGEEPEL